MQPSGHEFSTKTASSPGKFDPPQARIYIEWALWHPPLGDPVWRSAWSTDRWCSAQLGGEGHGLLCIVHSTTSSLMPSWHHGSPDICVACIRASGLVSTHRMLWR